MKKRKLFHATALVFALAALGMALTACLKTDDMEGPNIKEYEDDNGKHAVYEKTEDYLAYVAHWDGETAHFSDGSKITLGEGEVLTVEDKDGKVIDKYQRPTGTPVNPKEIEEKDGFTFRLIYPTKEDFYANRPTWNGKILGYTENPEISSGRVVGFGTQYIAEDNEGNILCIYGTPAVESTSGAEVKSITVQDDVTVITLDEPIRQSSFLEVKGNRVCFLWENMSKHEYKNVNRKYTVNTPYVAIVNNKGEMIEHMYVLAREGQDYQPSCVKKVFQEGFKTVAVIEDDLSAFKGFNYADGFVRAEISEGPFSIENVKNSFEGKRYIGACRDKVFFSDGGSLDIVGSKIVFISEEMYAEYDPEKHSRWNTDREFDNYWCDSFITDYYIEKNISFWEERVRFAEGTTLPEDPFFCILLNRKRILSPEDVTVEGNKIILPCGTEIVCPMDKAVFIYEGGRYRPEGMEDFIISLKDYQE